MSAATNTPFATTAHRYLAAGWSPLPLPAGAKANPPTGYTGAHGRRPGPDDLEQWLEHGIAVAGRQLVPAGNVAIRVPDTVVGVDVDQYGDKHGHDNLEQLLFELDITLPDTWISTARPAPSGIRWLRIPAGTRLRGAPLSGVEIVQAHHRYAVAPPSVHPTGSQYRWIAPGGELTEQPPTPDELPAMPAELVDAWRDTAEPARPRAAVPPAAAPAGRDRSRAVDEVLSSRRSWTPGGRHDEACRISMALARLEHSGHPGATEALELVGADFTAAVAGERDGDAEWRSIVDSARAKAAGTEATRPDYAELTRHITPTRSDGDNLAGLDVDADLELEAGELDSEWRPFEPLVRAQVATFPLDVLPDWIRTEVEQCADELAVPDDMPAVAALGAVAVMASGRVDVQPGPNFRTPTNLYVCIVAESGAGKSPVMARMVTAPARQLEQQLTKLSRSAVADSRARTARLEAARDDAAKKLKNNPTDSSERDLARAEAELLEHEPLEQPVVVLGDVTPERLTAVLAEQQGRAAIVTPEGGTLFESIAGLRYRAGGVDGGAKVPDVYLSGYSREALRTDRVGRNSVLVEQPTLNVITSVQPVVVERLAATPDVARQGALARFLWAWPAGRIGWRPQDSYRYAAADDGTYRSRLVELGLRARSWQTPLVYAATEAACDLRDAWAGELERRIRPGGDLHPHRAGVSKLQTTPWRLAGLLAFAEGARSDQQIDAELMGRALELCDYFLANAVAAEQVAGVAAGTDSAVHVLAAKLAQHAGEQLTIRDVQLAMRGTVSSVTDLAAPILELECMGWVRVDGDMTAIGRRGAPNPTLLVHPSLSPAALHPAIEPAELTREPRELIHRHGELEAETTREPRELSQDPLKFARKERLREGAFSTSSSSLDVNAEDRARANNRTARTEPLFDPTPNDLAPADLELGDDPFGPANANDHSLELW